ncbi:hypothetical protein C0J52_26517 [Blattella germanica]|nr:hypothetical protein C0J52_26517 [Blattella germanica]
MTAGRRALPVNDWLVATVETVPTEEQFPWLTRGKFPCSRCGREYTRRDTLLRHEKYECGSDQVFNCPFCPSRSKYKRNIDSHIAAKHWDKLPYN